MKINKIKNQIGTTAIEYGLLAFLIGVALLTVLSLVGANLSNVYCMISSKLVDSSSCNSTSNGSTGNTSSNGSTGSDTTTSSNPYLAGITKDLIDNLDLSYLSSQEGGTGQLSFPASECDHDANCLLDYEGGSYFLSKELQAINNSSDPITNVFGVYDNKTGEAITDPSTVIQDFTANSNTVANSHSDFTVGMSNPSGIEFTTQSGKVYKVQYMQNFNFSGAKGSSITEENGQDTVHNYGQTPYVP